MLARIKRYAKTVVANQADWPVVAYPWGRHLLVLLPVLASIVFFHVWIASHIGEYRTQHAAVTAMLKFATKYLLWVFYAAYVVLMIDAIRRKDYPRQRLVWRYLIFQLAISVMVVPALKNVLGHPRPGHEGTKPAYFKSPQAQTPDGYHTVLGVLCCPKGAHESFPSGHTTDILISTLPLALYYWRRYGYSVVVLCGLSAVMVVFSRLWLGMHHVEDALGSVVLASVGAYCILKKPPCGNTQPPPRPTVPPRP